MSDDFDDDDSRNGILHGAGVRDYDSISHTVEQAGVKVKLNCWACNVPCDVVLEWPEVITVAENRPGTPPLLPTGWAYSPKNKDAYVSIPCRRCSKGDGVSIHLTPEEARRLVQQGLSATYIHTQHITAIQQQMGRFRR